MDKILLKAAKHIMLFNTLSYFTWRILSTRESGLPRERYENTLVCKNKILLSGELFCFVLVHWAIETLIYLIETLIYLLGHLFIIKFVMRTIPYKNQNVFYSLPFGRRFITFWVLTWKSRGKRK